MDDGTPRSVYLSNAIFDSPSGDFTNYTSITLNDTLEDSSVYTINWTTNSSAPPQAANSSLAHKFVNISGRSGSPSIDYVSFGWTWQESSGYDESLLQLWRYNASSHWVALNTTPNMSLRTLSLYNVVPVGEYGILYGGTETTPCGNLASDITLITNLISDGNCFNISVDNITIDCAGFSLIGNRTGNGITSYGALSALRSNITIRNCNISNFTMGISFSSVTNSQIYNNSVWNNSDSGIYLNFASSNNITNNTLTDNSGAAIVLTNSSIGNNISSNDIYGNLGYGLDNSQAEYVNVTYNYWGTTSCPEISSLIYDYFDSPPLGVATFSPFLNATYLNGSSMTCPAEPWSRRVTNHLSISAPSEVCKGSSFEVSVSDKNGVALSGVTALLQIGGLTETRGVTDGQGQESFAPSKTGAYTILARNPEMSAEKTIISIDCITTPPLPPPPTVPPACVSDSDCAADKKCASGNCALVKGTCGHASAHKWIPYECCSDSGCPVNYECKANACVKKSTTENVTIKEKQNITKKPEEPAPPTAEPVKGYLEPYCWNPALLALLAILLFYFFFILAKRRKKKKEEKDEDQPEWRKKKKEEDEKEDKDSKKQIPV
ncbi:Periplasmic copper-binding protein (NosD) [Candidatus Gugararchaeum adminiculabundum]|nr:Periplasmic copper-binding protein (NosD) [Candidatus Gugararchaeum adminiculabundum]